MKSKPTIAIIGAGVAGLCMAMQLRRAGIESFTIFEKGEGIGGTWRNNTYPGSGCDVPSHLYCFSFEPNLEWTRKFAEQTEILEYLRGCAKKYGLWDRIRLETEITHIRHLDEERGWEIVTADGATLLFDVVVTGTGQLNRPWLPDIAGRDDFTGAQFHTAEWDHDHELQGRDVAVVGNGASAIQLVPHVARAARKLTIFQRSAHWIVPKPDRPYFGAERWLFRRLPALAKMHRASIYWQLEARFMGFRPDGLIHRGMKRMAEQELERVTDPELRAKLTPDYPIGCKRILISNDYFDTVQRPNVAVCDDAIERITAEGIVTARQTHAVDTIIYATGFESTRFLAPMEITGRNGLSLADAWQGGAEAYLGMTVPGFPSFFMLYGPNTNLGHSSIIFMIECQTRYILRCLEAMARLGMRELEVTRLAVERYNEEIQARLGETVWGAGCESWYRHESGKITNNWASFTTSYWWRTREPDLSAYVLRA